MSEADFQLTETFLKTNPDDAADLLELQPLENNVALLQSLAPASATILLIRMLPSYAARLCTALDAQTAGKLLAPAKVNQIVAILRFIPASNREALLKSLPIDSATACRLLLGYSPDTVGAWMIPQMIMLAEENTVTQALARLSMDTTAVDTDAIYVVDRDLKLRGMINMPVLLRAANDRIISTLLNPQTFALSGRASLTSVRHHAGWSHRDTLPVINRQQQLVGMLRHVDLRKGLDRYEHLRSQNVNTFGDGPLIDLYHSYGNVLVNLLNVFNDFAGNIRKPKKNGD